MRPRIFQVKQIIAHFLWQRILLIRFIAWFGLANTCFFWIIGSKYIATIFASNTLFFTTFYAYSSFLGKCFVIFFTIMTALSHFALLAFLPLIFLPAS